MKHYAEFTAGADDRILDALNRTRSERTDLKTDSADRATSDG
jgi:hypothetical protein